ncbi:cryptochrome/photolyase family protein [Alteromonas oceanisediminis]|uniref:cryptochrome/photolyase family protein n=1 Tax=Alteromonas oceanisediminis TaxID=2836180 RepID=UPI001BD970D6|nr:deoxyribodipyrimidine photo-lyase [Alteromonas oceanisediminis]MBT0587104.1 DNA photolyase family protein [Alteromonas oceanisediminis]
MTVATTLVWFRQDLRVKDNPALHWAVEQGKVIPLYIDDTETDEHEQLGGASKWWLHHSLTSLQQRLNGHLIIKQGDPADIIRHMLDSEDIDNVVWNRCYQPHQRERDKSIKTAIKDETDVTVKSFNGSLLWEPMQISKADGGPYKVFTPYYRKGCLKADAPRHPVGAPERITYADHAFQRGSVDDLDLLPSLDWDAGFSAHWKPGEDGASDKLSTFISDAALEYKDQRNIPSASGTSRLSPHLHFGEVSPNQVWYAILDAFDGSDNDNIDTYLSELGWREFSYYLLYHWPDFINKNFNEKFDDFPWRSSKKDLVAWQRGKTGIPIVDAGMRELWQTGYMHNRVRMVVGSFLVKNLLLDWREGERWFWDCLVDADLASNTAGWQWVGGSGADAAPYFRIFNPVLQGEKFDKAGEYVREYCPELSDVPNKYLHKPWDAPEDVLEKAGVTLGKEYPEPLVDLKASRQRALDAYQEIKG